MLGNDLIASYEVDFKLLKTIIDRKLDDARDLYGEPRKAVMREIERAIDDADEIVGLFIYLFIPLFIYYSQSRRLHKLIAV